MTASSHAETAQQVADLLEVVAAANRRIAAVTARITQSDATVNPVTVERLAAQAEDLGLGADARARLAEIDKDLLLEGTRVWVQRLRRAAGERPAQARARRLWNGAAR